MAGTGRIGFFERVAGSWVGRFAYKAWDSLGFSKAARETEAMARAKSAVDIARGVPDKDAAARLIADGELAKQALGPWQKAGIGAAVAVGLVYPSSHLDGYIKGRTMGFDDNSTDASWITMAGAGTAALLDFDGSASNFITTAHMNGWRAGYKKKLANMSPEERKNWPTEEAMLQRLAGKRGETYEPIRVAAEERLVHLGTGDAALENSIAQTAQLQAQSAENRREAIAKEQELLVAPAKEEARQAAALDQYKAAAAEQEAARVQTQQQQLVVQGMADRGTQDLLDVQARRGGYRPDTLATRFNQLGIVTNPQQVSALTNAFTVIAASGTGNNKERLDRAGMDRALSDPDVAKAVPADKIALLKAQVTVLAAHLPTGPN